VRRAAALASAGFFLAACAASSPSASPDGSSSTVPVAGGALDGSTTMAVLPMGHLDDPANRFYETFSQTGSGTWSLTTPEGTATNGGIVISRPANGAGAVLSYFNLRLGAGFELLDGRQTGAGQVLPLLAHVPSAMAVDPATGAVAALTESGEVVVASSLAGPFERRTSEQALAASSGGRSCGLRRLTAVGFTSTGGLAVGGKCARPGWSGIFLARPGTSALFTALPEVGSGPSTVLRLDAGAEGVHALTGLVLSSGGRSTLRAVAVAPAADAPGSTWSSPVQLLPGEQLRSTAGAPTALEGPTEIVTLAGARAVRVVALRVDQGGTPLSAPPLPVTAAAALLAADGSLTAIEVTGGGTAQFLTLSSAGGSAAWKVDQVIRVEVPYGSSS
jgi:hypothetical protein